MSTSSRDQEPALPAFGAIVKLYRGSRGISQERLAELAGVSPSYIALMETGRRGRRPSRDVAIRLAQALHAPVKEFLQAAGRLTPVDEQYETEGRTPEVEAAIQADVRLTIDQKRILIDMYRSWVGPPR